MQKWFGGIVIVGAFAIAAVVGTIASAQQPMPTPSACPSASPAAGLQATPAPTDCPSMPPAPSGTMSPAY